MSSADDYSECYTEIPETKRKSRNESEKRRRDAFNKLINELRLIVTAGDRTVDKSAVLQHTIHYLNIHSNEAGGSSVAPKRVNCAGVRGKGEVSFLTDKQLDTLFLQATDGFFVVLAHCGKMLNQSAQLAYILESQGISSSVAKNGVNFCDFLDSASAQQLRNFLSNEILNAVQHPKAFAEKIYKRSFVMQLNGKRFCGTLVGKFKFIDQTGFCVDKFGDKNPRVMLTFTGMACFSRPLPALNLASITGIKQLKNLQFTIIYNSHWTFMSLDQRAESILGYCSREVMGRSGLDYCHVQDIPAITNNLKTLAVVRTSRCTMQAYRICTVSGKWLWVQCQASVTQSPSCSALRQIVCTYRVNCPPDFTKSPSNNIPSPSISFDNGKVVQKGKQRQILNPQPGVSIEHSPITFPPNVNIPAQKPVYTNPLDYGIWDKLRNHQLALQHQVAAKTAELMQLQRQLAVTTHSKRSQPTPVQHNNSPTFTSL